MERLKLSITAVSVVCFLVLCKAIESPKYTVVHSESEFDIRLYRQSSWMSAPVRAISFHKATRNGYHRYSNPL